MAQKERILSYMKSRGSITQQDATNDLGCGRLAPRISEMIRGGIRISKVMERGQNRFGEPTMYARYFLEGK